MRWSEVVQQDQQTCIARWCPKELLDEIRVKCALLKKASKGHIQAARDSIEALVAEHNDSTASALPARERTAAAIVPASDFEHAFESRKSSPPPEPPFPFNRRTDPQRFQRCINPAWNRDAYDPDEIDATATDWEGYNSKTGEFSWPHEYTFLQKMIPSKEFKRIVRAHEAAARGVDKLKHRGSDVAAQFYCPPPPKHYEKLIADCNTGWPGKPKAAARLRTPSLPRSRTRGFKRAREEKEEAVVVHGETQTEQEEREERNWNKVVMPPLAQMPRKKQRLESTSLQVKCSSAASSAPAIVNAAPIITPAVASSTALASSPASAKGKKRARDDEGEEVRAAPVATKKLCFGVYAPSSSGPAQASSSAAVPSTPAPSSFILTPALEATAYPSSSSRDAVGSILSVLQEARSELAAQSQARSLRSPTPRPPQSETAQSKCASASLKGHHYAPYTKRKST